MRSDRTLALGAAVFAALSLAPAAAEEPKDIFTWGADLRLRWEFLDNASTLNETLPGAERSFARYRGRLWGQVAPNESFEAYGRLMWEGRYYANPDDFVIPLPGQGPTNILDTTYSGALMFDNLYVKLNRVGDAPLTLKIGRQDIFLGNGWLVADGTPLDGSRTFYFDAIRATYVAEPIGTTFDLIVLDNYHNTDRFPFTFNNKTEDQIEEDETGAILYARNKSLIKDTDLDGFFIYRSDDAAQPLWRVNNGFDPFGSPTRDGEVYALGARIDSKLTPNWNLRAEAAFEWGNRFEEDLEAFGFNGRVTYNIGDSLSNRLHLGYEYLSGDDPDTSKVEAFDPLWGRWPQWSELYQPYTYALDSRTGEATNLQRINLGWGMKPHPTTEVTLDYHALFANENTLGDRVPPVPGFSKNGDFRGHLFTGWVKVKYDKHVAGHLVAEYFNPGDYYTDIHIPDKPTWYRDQSAWYLRAEVFLTY
jgi:hypothetical protein